MSGKLGQSLDDIIKTRRSSRPARGSRTGRNGTRKVAQVAGGVSKNTKAPKQAAKAAAPSASGPSSSKILVSGLPFDVTEQQIKEYFQQTIAPVRQVVVTYGANGASRGIATITFVRPESGAAAAKQLNGTKVDGKPMKIEVILDPRQVPTAKALGDRIAQKVAATKDKPKAAAAKTNTKTGRAGAGNKRGGKSGRLGRSKPKTADELDAEMTDYFVTKDAPAATNSAAANGAVPTADASMDDQIM